MSASRATIVQAGGAAIAVGLALGLLLLLGEGEAPRGASPRSSAGAVRETPRAVHAERVRPEVARAEARTRPEEPAAQPGPLPVAAPAREALPELDGADLVAPFPTAAQQLSAQRSDAGKVAVSRAIAALPRRGAVAPRLDLEQRLLRAERRLAALERREAIERRAGRLAVELDEDEELVALALGGGRTFGEAAED